MPTAAFPRWLAEASKADAEEAPWEACAVDGKTVRTSFDAARGIPRTHIVSARLDCGLTVGQAAVPDKSNELTAIRQLLPAQELEGRVVSIDALACQTRHRRNDRGRRRLVPAGRQGQPVRPVRQPATMSIRRLRKRVARNPAQLEPIMAL
ncbi:MAG: ISAs1 family transposase [Caldilineaceae bacterium]|nr:ISAs1 family transposase [Caldilineaceae bacterium]